MADHCSDASASKLRGLRRNINASQVVEVNASNALAIHQTISKDCTESGKSSRPAALRNFCRKMPLQDFSQSTIASNLSTRTFLRQRVQPEMGTALSRQTRILGRTGKGRVMSFRTFYADFLTFEKTKRQGEEVKFESRPAQDVLDPNPLDSNGASVAGLASAAAMVKALITPAMLLEMLPKSEIWTRHDDYLLCMAVVQCLKHLKYSFEAFYNDYNNTFIDPEEKTYLK